MNKLKINNIILFDGKNEYNKSGIELNNNLKNVAYSVITLGGFASIIELINKENTTLYITSDLEHKKGSGKLINASEKLKKEFILHKP